MSKLKSFAFKVYCARRGAGEHAARQMVAVFVRYIKAETFIRSELLNYPIHSTDRSRFWGSNGNAGHIRYWIEAFSAANGTEEI